MLTSKHADTDTEPCGIELQAEQSQERSQSIVFDARDRLDGTLDDTTVRQAVRTSPNGD